MTNKYPEPGAERRTETRLDQQATIFVELLAADHELPEPPHISICSSIDLSAAGLQVRMNHPAEVGSILRLCAEFTDDRSPLYLVGEVKWQRPDGDGYFVGFALFESEHTDIDQWKQFITSQLG